MILHALLRFDVNNGGLKPKNIEIDVILLKTTIINPNKRLMLKPARKKIKY
jgi:hypothetical protein